MGASAQINIAFGYDECGNRISRGEIVLEAAGISAPEKKLQLEKEKEEPILYRELKVYPNPTQGQVKVELPVSADEAPFAYRVLTTSGHLLFSGQATNGVADIDLSSQPVGSNFVTLSNPNTTYNLKIVKQ